MRALALLSRGCAALALTTALALALAAQAADRIPAHVRDAVADKARPEADTSRDANRKPAEVIAFAQIERGAKVADLLPGRGYFTRIFSKAVGEKGVVYAMVPKEAVDRRPQAAEGVKAIAAEAGYANVKVVVAPLLEVTAPEPLDLVWTSDNYHDLKNPAFGGVDTVALNKAVFKALKPGGVYLVLDHAGAPGSGVRDAGTLHRIDPEIVKKEVLEAGFTLEAESNLLRNPSDDHTKPVVEGEMRGKTDQFIYRFRKPAK